jgi:aminoglycoside 6-adenylyltransferase
MDRFYQQPIESIKVWAKKDKNIIGIVVIGSQVRMERSGDEYSDLDLLVIVEDQNILINDDTWIEKFGTLICITKEDIQIDSMNLRWYIKRPLYKDMKAIDFSILTYGNIDNFLNINKEINYIGYQIIYEVEKGCIEKKIINSLVGYTVEQNEIPNEIEYWEIVIDFLYHIIWAGRKVKRNEIWTAANCINCYMKSNLLKVIEIYSKVLIRKESIIMYEGRLLEDRIDSWIKDELMHCFVKYDKEDIYRVLEHLIDFMEELSNRIINELKYEKKKDLFYEIRNMFNDKIKESPSPSVARAK